MLSTHVYAFVFVYICVDAYAPVYVTYMYVLCVCTYVYTYGYVIYYISLHSFVALKSCLSCGHVWFPEVPHGGTWLRQEGGPPEYVFFSASRTQLNADIDEDMSAAAGRAPFCIETETWIFGWIIDWKGTWFGCESGSPAWAIGGIPNCKRPFYPLKALVKS